MAAHGCSWQETSPARRGSEVLPVGQVHEEIAVRVVGGRALVLLFFDEARKGGDQRGGRAREAGVDADDAWVIRALHVQAQQAGAPEQEPDQEGVFLVVGVRQGAQDGECLALFGFWVWGDFCGAEADDGGLAENY